MIDPKYIEQVQRLVKEQAPRKKKLGRPRFNEDKFWEELKELRDELNLSLDLERSSRNLIAELGDFLFCVLSRPGLTEQLQRRMEFNLRRVEAYATMDQLKLVVGP